jgi:hypothetical protein
MSLALSGQADSLNLFAQQVNSVRQLDQFFLDNFFHEKRKQQFAIHLPTRLGIQADYRLKKSVYVSILGQISLRREGFGNLSGQSMLSIIPRIEKRDWEIAVSLSSQGFEDVYAGTSVD